MPWLYLLLALVAFTITFTSSSVLIVGLSLLAAIVLLAFWVLGLLARRVDGQARDDMLLLDPQELRRLREAAAERQQPQPPAEG